MTENHGAVREAVVTGGSSGIGLTLVERLLGENWRVTCVSRRPCPLVHHSLRSVSCDLSDVAAVSALPDLAGSPVPDAVVFCHGKGDFGAIEQFSERRIREMVDLHLTATLMLCRRFVPAMKKRGRGNLVFLGSESALKGARRGVVYCATKFALRGAAQSLREECSGRGVHVGIVNPGMVDTPFFDDLDFAPGADPANALETANVVDAILLMLNAPANAVVDEINLSPMKKVVRRD